MQTAVVALSGDQELHLAAMRGGGGEGEGERPGFWAYVVQRGQYEACLRMLNASRLALVFDLDETLVVARTVRGFRDEVAKLEGVLEAETDPGRKQSLVAERQKIEEDYALLKRFADHDKVCVDGREVLPVMEEAFLDADVEQAVLRPVIRLPARDTVITRIFPGAQVRPDNQNQYWNDRSRDSLHRDREKMERKK